MSAETVGLTAIDVEPAANGKHRLSSLPNDEILGKDQCHGENHSSKLDSCLKVYFKQIRLVVRSVVPDLRSFQCWQLMLLLLYASFNATFSILVIRSSASHRRASRFSSQDFNSFFPFGERRALLKWTNDFHASVPVWRRVLLCFSGLSAITNVLNVVLVVRGKISSYFWGILGALLYGSYAFAYGYVGDAQLFLFFFLPMEFIGIMIWSNELDNKSTTRVKSLTFTGWLFVFGLGSMLTCLFFYEIPLFSTYLTSRYLFENRFFPHLLDALTNAMSVVGQCLLILCYWEQYIVWTAVNLILIVMYSGKRTVVFDQDARERLSSRSSGNNARYQFSSCLDHLDDQLLGRNAHVVPSVEERQVFSSVHSSVKVFLSPVRFRNFEFLHHGTFQTHPFRQW